jgi:hypothetical protein
MRASSRKLASALVSRLNDVVPTPFRLSALGNLLHIEVGETVSSMSSTLDIVDDESRDLTERLETAVDSVLNTLQDDISEYLCTPWPSLNGRMMAMPEVHSDGEWLHLGYGDRKAPILSLPSIRIADIMDPDGANSSAT